MRRALLLDLDETLIPDEPAAVAAFEATAGLAASRYDVDVAALAVAARARARELWNATPEIDYCRRIGMSSWEGLWSRFEGHEPSERWLREWSPTYRREAWRLALAEQGVEDAELAEELGERFGAERRRRLAPFDDVASALAEVSASHALALVTNGLSCLQREKLAVSGLGEHFAAVVVSAEFGVGKPDAGIFRHALAELDAEDGVMVGDSLARDVDGALAAGLGAVWVNRYGRPRPEGRPDLVEVSTLAGLTHFII